MSNKKRKDKKGKNVIGQLLFFVLIFLSVGIFVAKLYDIGINRPSLMYRTMPSSTVSWVNSMHEQDPSQMMYASNVGPYNWDNKSDIGQNKSAGTWAKREDANNIVYYRKDKEALGQSRALVVSNCLEDMMMDVIDLFGGYVSPDSLNGRKLVIYLPNTDEEFDVLLNKLSDGRSSFKHKYGCSFIELGPLGCQNKGILLHPKGFVEKNSDNHFKYEKVLRREVARYVYFSSLDYNKTINHYCWFTEGIIEYFALNLDEPFVLEPEMIDIIEDNCYLLGDFKSSKRTHRWAGTSFFLFYADKYGEAEVAHLEQDSYENSIDTIFMSLPISPDSLHLQWVESLRLNVEIAINDSIGDDNQNIN